MSGELCSQMVKRKTERQEAKAASMKTSTLGTLGEKGRLKERAEKWPNRQKQRWWSLEVPAGRGWKGPERFAKARASSAASRPRVGPSCPCTLTYMERITAPHTGVHLCTSRPDTELFLLVF